MIRNDGRQLTVSWGDGFAHGFHALWLRERSFEPTEKDGSTGHRLYEAAFLPLDLRIADAREAGGAIVLEFSDGHCCRFDLDDLRRAATKPLPDDLVGEKIYWDARHSPLTWHDFAAFGDAPERLLDLIGDLAMRGFAHVRNMPAELDGLLHLTDLVGPIRQTNWGGIADVKSIKNGYDLSMTARALEPHVDNPYRLPGPGFIFLHCIAHEAEGGESIIVDGHHVAARLRREHPEDFAALCETPVTFRYADDSAVLEHYGHLIELRPDGDIFRTIFHNRSDQVIAGDVEALDRYYRARRRYADLIWSPEMRLTFKLRPGEAYVVDNFRIFHGRTAFDATTGDRFLRQCYMDRDIVSSKQKTMLRACGRYA